MYAIDPTPKSLEYLQTQQLPNNFHVLPYALSETDALIEFALPTTEGWVSGSIEKVRNDERNLDFENTIKVEGKTIKSIMRELGHDRIDLLKLDIEGAEFAVLKTALSDGLDIRQMCIDHHEYMFEDSNDKLTELVDGLHQHGYSILYVEMDSAKCRSFTCMKNKYIGDLGDV